MIKKRSNAGRFDSGSVTVSLPSGETLTATGDTRTGIVMSADLKTSSGDPVRFTANVRLQPASKLDAAE